MKKYRVFLSHRFESQDRQRAYEIETALSKLSDNVDIFNPGSDIVTSSTWRDEISRELANSDMLLLLYSDPRQDWAWCTYEAGLFSHLDNDENDHDPIVVIHYDMSDPPSQLEHLQCLEAKPERVFNFLHNFYRTTEVTQARWPLDSRITDEELQAAADLISGQFQKPEQFYATYRLELSLPEELNEYTTIPSEAKVIKTTPGTLDLFGISVSSEQVWGDLIASHSDADWLAELNTAFEMCVERRMPEPSKKTFRPPRSSEIVRPSIFRVDSYDSLPQVLYLIFTLEPSPGKVGGRVFNMLRSLERSRKELIQRFVDRTEPTDPILSPQYNLGAISVAAELIKDEAEELGVFDNTILTQCFQNNDVVQQLNTIVSMWNEASNRMLLAIDNEDPSLVLQALLEISNYIDIYAKIASKRYAELVDKRPTTDIVNVVEQSAIENASDVVAETA
ncbi:MAG: toll/interleukin-1 receptor domain-containing protein [Granulosicoccus sp.]